jgi:large subunit ribosomal protein L29
MKQEEIKELSTDDLQDRLTEEKMFLNKTKLHHAVSQIENPQVIKQSRRSIARIMTELRTREIEAANK